MLGLHNKIHDILEFASTNLQTLTPKTMNPTAYHSGQRIKIIESHILKVLKETIKLKVELLLF